VSRVCLMGTARTAQPDDVAVLSDPGGGLNAAAKSALAQAEATRLIVIHADLPLVTSQDIELLAAAPAGTIAIAPDRHGTGTNAISLPLPAAKGFSFAFGTDSFARHKAEADRIGLRLEEIHSQGLARDVDEPDDLIDAAVLLKE
ncbi:MAG TPA: 2-phospho-L-lactate guanylyltransferase, partial [Novosphingobium sp.]